MSLSRGDYIGGRFISHRHPDRHLSSIDPGDLEKDAVIFAVADSSINAAVEAAQQAFEEYAKSDSDFRSAILRKIKAQLRNRMQDLIDASTLETGIPKWEAREQVIALRQSVDIALRQKLPQLTSDIVNTPGSFVMKRPKGVVVILASSTQPLVTIHTHVLSALAVGCTVILKPSEQTPYIGQLYAELMHDVDPPRGVFNMIQGDAQSAKALVEHPLVDVVLIGGRQETIRQVESHLFTLDHFRRPQLGALSSGRPLTIVHEDANLDEAAVGITIGSCISCGQRATSTRGVIIHKRVFNALKARLLKRLSELRIGYTTQSNIFMGPLISKEAQTRFFEQFDHLKTQANVEITPVELEKSDLAGHRGYYVSPAMLQSNLKDIDRTLTDEVVGPMIVIAEYEHQDQIHELIRKTPHSLCHAIYSRRPMDELSSYQQLITPLIFFNRPTTHDEPELLVEIPSHYGTIPMPFGLSTAYCLTTHTSLVARQSAFDLTMLPPGMSNE